MFGRLYVFESSYSSAFDTQVELKLPLEASRVEI